MTLHRIIRHASLSLISVGGFSALSVTHAQVAPTNPSNVAAPERDIVELNPFQVNEDQDRGFAAGNTLSGGRAEVPLKTAPMSISVMTREFIDDFGITDMTQASKWTISMDPPVNENTGPFGGQRFQASFRNGGNGPNFPQRNGFLSYFVADAYNSERFEFSRGPSTALFGDGGPGGTQGSISKKPFVGNTATEVTLRYDTFESYRATLDVNYGTDKFAIRVMGLKQDTKSWQNSTTNKQTAGTIGLLYKINDRTSVRAEFENSHERNLMYNKIYNDQASLWNGQTVNENNTAIANPNNFGLETFSPTQDYIVYNFGVGRVLNYTGNQYRTRGLGFNIPWQGRPELPHFPSVSRDFALGPVDQFYDRDFNQQTFWIEHRFTTDLYLQLSMYRADTNPYGLYAMNLATDYRIDVNRLLPDGTANPKFGKPFSEFSQNRQEQRDHLNEYRAFLTYRFEIPKAFDLKERLSLNLGWRRGLFQLLDKAWRWSNNPNQADLNNAANNLNYRVYWDEPEAQLGSLSSPPPALPGMTWQEIETGGTRNQRTITYGQIVSTTSFLDDKLVLTGVVRSDRIEGDFFGRIRGGNADTDYKNVMGFPANATGTPGVHGLRKLTQNSPAVGLVTYPFPTRYKWLAPIGFVVNKSRNFQQLSSSLVPMYNGEAPPLTWADTTDYGIRYSLGEGIAYVTITHYDTEQHNNLQAFGNQPDFRTIWQNLGSTDQNLIGSNAFNYQDTNDRNLKGWEIELTANPTRNLTLTANYAAPEVYSVTDSPGRRAYYDANRALFAQGAAAQPGQVVNGMTIIDPGKIQQSMLNIENSLAGFAPGVLSSGQQGGTGAERHRFNFAASYRFMDGTLKGLGVTAGLIYRGSPKIGARDPNLKFNTNSPTIAQQVEAAYDYLRAPSYYSVSAGLHYTRKFGRYTTRFQVNVSNLLDDDTPQWTGYSVITANQLLNGNPRMQVPSTFNFPEPRRVIFSTTVEF